MQAHVEMARRLMAKLLVQREKIQADYLIVLTERHGSSPQKEGAFLLVNTRASRFWGTVGGGLVEHTSIELAKALAPMGLGALADFSLSSKQAGRGDLGMACGGRNTLLFLPIDQVEALTLSQEDYEKALSRALELRACDKVQINSGLRLIAKVFPSFEPKDALGAQTADATDRASLNEATQAIYERFSPLTRRFRVFQPGEDGPRFLSIEETVQALEKDESLAQSCETARHSGAAGSYYIFRSEQSPRVILFGAGHVARALSRALGTVGWPHAVIDDREDVLDPEFFSPLAELICSDVTQGLRLARAEQDDYYCIMTRGHKGDGEALAHILPQMPRYVGVMGSKRKVLGLIHQLEEQGFTKELLSHVHMPIGLDIGAITPEEIAISVLAEMIAHYRGVDTLHSGSLQLLPKERL